MPRGRKENITGSGSFHKTGDGLGSGPVSGNDYSNRPGTHGSQQSGEERGGLGGGAGGNLLFAALLWLLMGRRGGGSGGNGGGGSLIGKIIRIAVIVLIISAVMRACSGTPANYGGGNNTQNANVPSYSSGSSTQTQTGSVSNASDLFSIPYGMSSMNSSYSSTGWTYGSNTGRLNTTVVPGTRAKFYSPAPGDKVNIMVYMIGTDLESGSGMATSDLQEMANATISDNVNLIVYGGGCTGWKNNVMSNSSNIIYKVTNGGRFTKLADNGDRVMTDPATLAGFINAVGQAYPAQRNILILWDHGGGSLSGYGYDQRHKSSGPMDLEGISKAVKAGGVKFDFIGFDACLMATTETGLTLADYADYLIGSEESEPGIGWYYTNWLTELSNNTSVSTLELGKRIADDFVDVCAQRCPGQDTTLSVVDLAELSKTVPSALNTFASTSTKLIQSNDYKMISTARSSAKEFAASSRIDQCDLVDLAMNTGTDAGKSLAQVLLNAVKYNRTSTTVTDAYGLSVYFPYRSTRAVNTALKTYSSIGIDAEYQKCIRAYASLASSGQAASGGYASPFGSLSEYLGGGTGSSSAYGSSISQDAMLQILQSMMSGRSLGNVEGLNEENGRFISDTFSDGTLDADTVAQYITDNQFNASSLVWTKSGNGQYQISLPEDQWALINEVVMSVFYDTGDGFADLGTDLKDNAFTKDGALVGSYDGAWTAINGLPVAYYTMSSYDDGTNWQITGYVPCLLNGERTNLVLIFDNDHEYGYVAGTMADYQGAEANSKIVTERVDGILNFDDGSAAAKDGTETLGAVNPGDRIDFICSYYDYDGNFEDTYVINSLTVDGDLEISYVMITNSGVPNACYRLTDIYGQTYWTAVIPNE